MSNSCADRALTSRATFPCGNRLPVVAALRWRASAQQARFSVDSDRAGGLEFLSAKGGLALRVLRCDPQKKPARNGGALDAALQRQHVAAMADNFELLVRGP